MKQPVWFVLYIVAFSMVAFVVIPIVGASTKVRDACLQAGWPDSTYYVSGSYCQNAQHAVVFDKRWEIRP